MVGEGAVDGLVVGVAQDAARRGDEFRVGGIGHHAVPAVFGDPAGAGHATLALMLRIAARQGADGLHGDRVTVHQCEVLSGGDIVGRGVDGLLYRFCTHHLHCGSERAVVVAQQRRGERGHMARRCNFAKVVVAAGQHWAIVRPAQCNGDGVGVFDVDD